METKKCSRCKTDLPIDEFYIKYRRASGDRRYSECKNCRSIISKKNSQSLQRKEYAKNYYLSNKDTIRSKQNSYYKNNTDHVKKLKAEWRDKNQGKRQKILRDHNKKMRNTFMQMYGNRCVCCGETIEEFLTIEHKLGQKGIVRQKKETGKFAYSKAIKEFRPDLYEILCWNCNCAKGRYGYCPHEKFKETNDWLREVLDVC